MHIELGPEAPLALRIVAGAALAGHIGGGLVGIASGLTAIIAKKGERLHRYAGRAFVVSMLIMTSLASLTAPFLPDKVNVIMGLFTFYLVVTAWRTARRSDGPAGTVERIAVVAALAIAALSYGWGLHFMNAPDPDNPPAGLFVAGTLALFAAALDLRRILGGLTEHQRLTRHLWRMGASLVIATGSFFLGQAELFPDIVRGKGILPLPVLFVLGATLYWSVRTRFFGPLGGEARLRST